RRTLPDPDRLFDPRLVCGDRRARGGGPRRAWRNAGIWRAPAPRAGRRTHAVDLAVQPVVAMTAERSARSGPQAPGPVKRVTSLANPIVKDIRGLALGKNRKASGKFIAEGLKLVADGVDAGWRLD